MFSVSFACISGLNNRGGVSGVHAADQTSTQNYTRKFSTEARALKNTSTKISTERPHQKNMYNNTNTNRTTNTKKPTQIQLKIQIQMHQQGTKSKYARKYKPRRDVQAKHSNVVFCDRACLCRYNKVGMTRQRRCSGVPKGAERSFLTHFRGGSEKGNVVTAEPTNCACPVITSEKTRRRHSPAAMYTNTQLFGKVVAVHAITQFHATGKPRA